MKSALAPAVGLVLAILSAACSSEPSPETSGAASTATDAIDEPVEVAASKETRDQLGVSKWGYDATATTVAISGYDASNARVLGLKHIESVDDAQLLSTLAVTRADGSTATRRIAIHGTIVDGTASTHTEVLEDTFDDPDELRRLLDRVASDASGEPRLNLGDSQRSLTSSSVHANTALVKAGGVCLTNSTCGLQIVSTVQGAISSAVNCSLLVAAADATAGCALVTAETVVGAIGCVAAGAVPIAKSGALCGGGLAKTFNSGSKLGGACGCK